MVTGSVAWSQGTGGPVYTSPTVGIGGVFALGAAKFHAFEATTGSPRFVIDLAQYGEGADNGVTLAVLTDSRFPSGGAVFFANGARRNATLSVANPMTGALVNGCPRSPMARRRAWRRWRSATASSTSTSLRELDALQLGAATEVSCHRPLSLN